VVILERLAKGVSATSTDPETLLPQAAHRTVKRRRLNTKNHDTLMPATPDRAGSRSNDCNPTGTKLVLLLN